MRKTITLFCLLLLIPRLSTAAEKPLRLNSAPKHMEIASHFRLLEDASGSLTIAQAADPVNNHRYRPITDHRLRFGYSRSHFWLKITITNVSGKNIRFYYAFYGNVDHISLYVPEKTGFKEHISGSAPPAHLRATESFAHAFPFTAPPGATVCYFKIFSNTPVALMPMILAPSSFQHGERFLFALIWFFAGLMAAKAIYNIFIYNTVREKSYLYLVYCIITTGLALTHETGVIKRYFDIHSIMLQFIFFMLSLTFLAMLTRSFLNTGRYLPRLDKILHGAALMQFAALPLGLVLHEYYLNQLIMIVSTGMVLLIIITGAASWYKKTPSARFFLAATALYLFGLLMMLLDVFYIFPRSLPHEFVTLLGFIIMVSLFSLGITKKISKLQDERLKALEALRESENKLRGIFENASEGIFQLSPKMELLTINTAMAKIFGFSCIRDLKNCHCFRTYLDEDTPELLIREAEKEGGVKNLESRAFRSDGRPIYISINANAVRDEEGKTLYYEGFLTDITERKHSEKLLLMAKSELEERVIDRTAELSMINESLREEILERKKMEAALKKSEDRYRQLIDTMNEGFAILDREHRLRYINPKLLDMFGYENASEVLGRPISDFLDDENRHIMEEQLIMRKKGSRFPYEINWLRKNNDKITTIVSPHPILDDDGGYDGSSAVLTDITALKEVEIHLKNAKESAEQANAAKSEFLANMSHEIRTPLNAVLGFTDLLHDLISDPKQRSYLESIKSSGKNLLMLINDILDLSRIEAGKLELQYEAVNPYIIMNEMRQIFSLKIEEKGLDFMIDIPPDIPESLLLDEVRLRQILFNLIGNAVKFTDKGFIRLAVRKIYTREDKSTLDLQLEVEDTGIGISRESREKIFDAFRQQDGQSTKKYGGTGLGLAITKRLVEMLRGEIALAGEPGKGSTFSITLHDVAVASTEATPRERNGEDYLDAVFIPALILVVDDVEENRLLVKEFLLIKNFTVIEAENGAKALEAAALHKPRLILMDIKMPEMDGYEANRRIKQDESLRAVPVVALTASAMKGEREKVLREGFDGFLHKPVQKGDLFRELARFIPHTIEPGSCEITAPQNAASSPAPQEPAVILPPDLKNRLPELREQLQNRFLPRWRSARENGFFNEITDFAETLRQWSAENDVEAIQQYAQTLADYTTGFDILNMNKTLGEFPKLAHYILDLEKTDGTNPEKTV